MKDPVSVLNDVFGYETFRDNQEAIVRHVVGGGDCIVYMPTGGGKSMCFWIPSICRPGMGVIVSPLIALMRDQVDALRTHGVKAGMLNSTLSADEAVRIRRAAEAGQLDLLYVSPERLLAPGFLEWLAKCRLALIAVDEAHCVSQWSDFRPEYQQLAILKDVFPGVPRMAVTATADLQTRKDIRETLRLDDALEFMSSFDRPNISYTIVEKEGSGDQQMLSFVKSRPGVPGIVYCLSRRKVDATAKMLSEAGVVALPYHAGLDRAERDANQDAFIRGRDVVMVATIAFGMGIDKPDVRYVYHADLPGSIEALYQEQGRASRDGRPAEAHMAYGLSDVVQRRRMIDMGDASATVKRLEKARLNTLLGLCETASCRRQVLLAHFGEQHAGSCGNCDRCLHPVLTYDATEPAQKAMSAIARTGQRFGSLHLIDVLMGRRTDKVASCRHDQLALFGIGRDLPEQRWRSLYRQLVALGHVGVDHEFHGALFLEASARAVLKGEERLWLAAPSTATGTAGSRRQRTSAAAKDRSQQPKMDAAGESLFQALRAERARQAREQRVPPYVIFNDATLVGIAIARPRDRDALSRISGVGQAKLDRYGDVVLSIVAERA